MAIFAIGGMIVFILSGSLSLYFYARGIGGISYAMSLGLAMWGFLVASVSTIGLVGVYFLQHI